VADCSLLSTTFKLPENCTGYGILEIDDTFFTSSESQTTLDNLLEKSK
jgi:hypothetical protein